MKPKQPQPEPQDPARAYCLKCRSWFPIDADNTEADHLLEAHLPELIAGRITVPT